MPFIDLNSSLLHDQAKKLNKYVQVLIDSFKLYSEENVDSTEKASTIAREFVWNLKNDNGKTFLFFRGSMHDCLEVFEHILENLSAELYGRVYSTTKHGMHFFTVCYKIIAGTKYLVRICNLTKKLYNSYFRRRRS